MLAAGQIDDVVEPPLPIDQEWMRLITPGQPRDDNGLRAMSRIAESGRLAPALSRAAA